VNRRKQTLRSNNRIPSAAGVLRVELAGLEPATSWCDASAALADHRGVVVGPCWSVDPERVDDGEWLAGSGVCPWCARGGFVPHSRRSRLTQPMSEGDRRCQGQPGRAERSEPRSGGLDCRRAAQLAVRAGPIALLLYRPDSAASGRAERCAGDCSFAEKQSVPPALLVVARGGRAGDRHLRSHLSEGSAGARRRLLCGRLQQAPPDVTPPGPSAIEIASARNASPSPSSSRSMNTWTLIRFPVPSATRKVPISRNSPTVAMPAP
jgi:hypothetical protein